MTKETAMDAANYWEVVADIAFTAGWLMGQGKLQVENSRELMANIGEWAREFEEVFNRDHHGDDYIELVDEYAHRRLLGEDDNARSFLKRMSELSSHVRGQALMEHAMDLIDRGWPFVQGKGDAEVVFLEERKRLLSVHGENLAHRNQALEGIVLRLVEVVWPHVYDKSAWASNTANIVMFEQVFENARKYLVTEMVALGDLRAALKRHPEIHVEQAFDGQWNFRHDDNEAGPDDNYSKRGCYLTEAGAILAAFGEYGVDLKHGDIFSKEIVPFDIGYFIRCEEASLGLLKSFGVKVGDYDHKRNGVMVEASIEAMKKVAEFPADFRVGLLKTEGVTDKALSVIERFEELGYEIHEDNGWILEMAGEPVSPDDLPPELRDLFRRLEGDGGFPQLKPECDGPEF